MKRKTSILFGTMFLVFLFTFVFVYAEEAGEDEALKIC